jgi:hypothetical protein
MFVEKLLLIDDHEEKCSRERISRMEWAVAGTGNGAQGFGYYIAVCYSKKADPQTAHLVLPDTQTDPSQNQKSHFLPPHRQE